MEGLSALAAESTDPRATAALYNTLAAAAVAAGVDKDTPVASAAQHTGANDTAFVLDMAQGKLML